MYSNGCIAIVTRFAAGTLAVSSFFIKHCRGDRVRTSETCCVVGILCYGFL